MEIDKEKLKYVLAFMDQWIMEEIDRALCDSETDPHKSAVAINNLIKCYIALEQQVGYSLPFHDPETFFRFNAYTKAEWEQFERKRTKESTYYLGIQL